MTTNQVSWNDRRYRDVPRVCCNTASLRRALSGNEHMLDEALYIMRSWGAVVVQKHGKRIRVIAALKG